MKEKMTPVAYPTTKEEEIRWGFDVFKPKGLPMCWITDWKGASAGFGLSPERVAEVVEFRTGEDLSQLSVDDVFAGHTQMFKMHWHTLLNGVETMCGGDMPQKVARELGYPLGARGWKLLQERFGSPVPLEKIVWYQDFAHLLYGPDTHGYSWCDKEKSVCCRTRCLFRPPKGMESCARNCRTFDNAYIEAYMEVEPDLLCVRVPDLGDDSSGERCVHLWTYDKALVEELPIELKEVIPDSTKQVLRGKGVQV